MVPNLQIVFQTLPTSEDHLASLRTRARAMCVCMRVGGVCVCVCVCVCIFTRVMCAHI